MDHVLLTFEPLSLSEINDLVADDSCGAISSFVGTTRDNFESKKVLSLEYEAYEPMAIKEIKKICHELRSRWTDIVNIAVYHRLGLVKVREASVIIAISSPHRQTSLDAVAQAIEELKCRVPIWKKEKYEDDESAWKENKECSWLNKTVKRRFQNVEIICQMADDTQDLSNFVQITAPESEINRRIESFVKKKRDQINLSNTLEFMGTEHRAKSGDNDYTSCARTDSIVVKQESSKGHLRVRRARNAFGPQTKPDYLRALNNHMSKMKQSHSTSESKNQDSIHPEAPPTNIDVNERLSNIEDFLQVVNAKTRPIHERLKEVENRILSLEAISPEYKHFFDRRSPISLGSAENTHAKNSPSICASKRKTYSIKELDDLIRSYEQEHDNRNDMSN